MKKKIFSQWWKQKKLFIIVVNKFPKTEYALDAKFKLDLIRSNS
jgi:outer membrane protein assembly factor BamD (BamD/ComL family)